MQRELPSIWKKESEIVKQTLLCTLLPRSAPVKSSTRPAPISGQSSQPQDTHWPPRTLASVLGFLQNNQTLKWHCGPNFQSSTQSSLLLNPGSRSTPVPSWAHGPEFSLLPSDPSPRPFLAQASLFNPETW
jgi:hypothetical protein